MFNLISRANETWYMEWHETCKCKCGLYARVCNNKQRWSDGECRCECNKLLDKGICDRESIWNSSNCKCEFDNSCNVGEYLDYINCKCRKKIVDKLVEYSSAEEYTENVDEVKPADENECVCSYKICAVMAVTALAVSIGIGAYFTYKYMNYWHLKKDFIRV